MKAVLEMRVISRRSVARRALMRGSPNCLYTCPQQEPEPLSRHLESGRGVLVTNRHHLALPPSHAHTADSFSRQV